MKWKMGEMNVGDEDGEPVKKVKLSKEEKKVLKKMKKRERIKEVDADAVSHTVIHSFFQLLSIRPHQDISQKREKKEKKKEGKDKENEEDKAENMQMNAAATTSLCPVRALLTVLHQKER